MPHRAKNKHRARHRAHTFKAPSLAKPASPLPTEQALAGETPIADATSQVSTDQEQEPVANA
jgi:hypothetical protein